MKKNILKLTALCIICALIFTFKSCKNPDFSPKDIESEQLQEPLTRSGDLSWDYPIKPGMEEWNSLKTEKERIAVLQVPESILASLSSEEVVGLCITFPSFGHFTAWDTPQESFNVMLSRYNILRHLLSRRDAGKYLIFAYKDVDLLSGFKTLPYSNRFFNIRLYYIELLLAQKEILQSLSSEERLELMIAAREKFYEKIGNEAFASLPGICFTSRIMASILDVEKYPEFETSANRQSSAKLIQTGWFFDDVQPIEEVVRISDNYINEKNEIK